MKRAVAALILLIVSGSIIYGCQTKKKLITFVDSDTFFHVVGYAKQAPFSPDPNLYTYLELEPQGFVSDQIVNILVFLNQSGEVCVIYKTANGEHILVCRRQIKERKRINSPEELVHLEKKIKVLKKFGFVILNHKVILNDAECIMLNWRSSGINIFSFKQFKEGLISSFSYKNLEKGDPNNSGKIIFTEWDKNDENWPEIKEFQIPLIK